MVCWSIKSLIAVAGDSARFVTSINVQEEVPGVMGLEVQSEQQEEQCPLGHQPKIRIVKKLSSSKFPDVIR